MNPLIPSIISTVIETLMAMPADAPPPLPAVIRPIPVEARSAVMVPPQDGFVALDGEVLRLAPGAQIRDAQNRVVQPLAVRADAPVRYLQDENGDVARIWILAPGEPR
jgi:hypothetical protein